MSTTNLLKLDVTEVFEQHNVGEIELINRKITVEIEKKREELRTMVKLMFFTLKFVTQLKSLLFICFRSVRDTEISFKLQILLPK